ncbi:MAG: hypothetical protein ACI92S_002798, partial [Planctomycetaceae bacterium]
MVAFCRRIRQIVLRSSVDASDLCPAKRRNLRNETTDICRLPAESVLRSTLCFKALRCDARNVETETKISQRAIARTTGPQIPSDSTMKCLFNAISVVAVLTACSVAAADDVDFKRDIAPILEERCWYCHGEDEQESNLRLDLRA